MQLRWTKKPLAEANTIQQLVDELNVPKALALILAQRGIDDFSKAKAFFRPKFEDLHDPFLMKDMPLAVKRIQQAINQNENILIYGDYDVDGTTSVAFMYLFLKQYHNNLHYYIPDRYKEGYGISKQGIDFAIDNNFSLIIALDCGIKAIDNIAYAKENQIDFIVCDHHLPSNQLPNAVAVLDPKREDCNYPYPNLSGCGVGFKLAQAFCRENNIDEKILIPFLDLLAISIAADIVPITGENRVLAHLGLQQINTQPRMGVKHLIPSESANHVDITRIVFAIAPKINAAGRIKHATDAVELLLVDNEMKARAYVSQINALNSERKELDATITDEAMYQIRTYKSEKNYSTVVYSPDWHKGVLGIVASRLIERYYRPTLVFTDGHDGEMVASARSVKGFDIYEAIENCGDLLDRFGGHKYAAGLSMQKENYTEFKSRFEQLVKENINQSQMQQEIQIDAEIEFNEITPKFLRILKQLAPFGPDNMKPVFLSKNIISGGNERVMGKTGEHLKLDLFQQQSHQLHQAIGFGMAKEFNHKIKPNQTFDIVYTIEENYWQGKTFIQLNLKDFRINESNNN